MPPRLSHQQQAHRLRRVPPMLRIFILYFFFSFYFFPFFRNSSTLGAFWISSTPSGCLGHAFLCGLARQEHGSSVQKRTHGTCVVRTLLNFKPDCLVASVNFHGSTRGKKQRQVVVHVSDDMCVWTIDLREKIRTPILFEGENDRRYPFNKSVE